MKLGIDAGNYEVKIFGEQGAFKYISVLGEYRERKLKNSFNDQDIVYEFGDRKGFAGKLAEIESEFSGSMYGTSKAHEDTLIRVLLGIAQYGAADHFYEVIVGQPIVQHVDDEKSRIKEMLLGVHRITVNDQAHVIRIRQVEVAAEGGVAFWSNPRKGLVRILDFGSGTVNGATLLDAKYVDRESFTLGYGLSTIQTDNKEAFMRAVFIETQKRRWKKTDLIYIVGGSAEEILNYALKMFENVELLRPKSTHGGRIEFLHPVYANCVGMYNVAKEIFK